MSSVYNWSLREFLAKSASAEPTPGGGSISALAGSLGTAMVTMVANLTVGKEKYLAVEPVVQASLVRLNELLQVLEGLVNEDIQVFNNFMAVLKLPKESDADKAERTAQMQQALKHATETPLQVARTCLATLEIAEQLSSIGNKGAISDIGVGAYLAEAALQSALLSVDINLPGIKDEKFVTAVRTEQAELVRRGQDLKNKAVAAVRERM